MTITRDDIEDYFSAAQQLYWYCVNNHTGQNSELYSILSQLDYTPGPMETKPEEWNYYYELSKRELDPANLLEAIQAAMEDDEDGTA